MKKIYFAIPIATFLIACGSGNKATDSDIDNLNKQAGAGSNPATDSNTTEPTVEKKIIGDGTWEIGKKEDLGAGVIVPGTYVISALEDGYNCYYARVSGFDGEMDSIIDNGNIDPGTTDRITVKKTDAGLILNGECLAKKK